MTDLIFHLGLTKTGSSFLQRKVFGGKVKTLSRAVNWEEDSKLALDLQRFFLEESNDFWASNKAKTFFNDHIVPAHEAVVLSHESLFKHIPYVDSEEELSIEPLGLAKKLRTIGEYCWPHGKVKVLFFFRKQDDWLASMYSHVAYAIKGASQGDFEVRVGEVISNKSRMGHILEYDQLYGELSDALGEGNVLAIPYEKFSEKAIWKKIESFIGVAGLYEKIPFSDTSVNTKRDKENGAWRPSGKRLVFAGIDFNSWGKSLLRLLLGEDRAKRIVTFLRPSPGWSLELSDSLRYEVLERYKASNMRMSKICGYDLSKENYY